MVEEVQQTQFHSKDDPSKTSEALKISISQMQHEETKINENHHDTIIVSPSTRSIFKHWGWWLAMLLNVLSELSGLTIATLLGRFYFNQGGTSMWMATLVQSAGAPLVLPFVLFSRKYPISRPPLLKMFSIYIVLGFILAGVGLMFSYGLRYLPVSTYSLICATQLVFISIFSYFINKQKLTPLIFNAIVLLTFSAVLLGLNSESSTTKLEKSKYTLGFVLTLAAAAGFSLFLSLIQHVFQKVIKAESFFVVLEVQMCSNIVASIVTVVGLFISGEWRGVKEDFEGYQTGKVSYVLTLVGTAVSWQVTSVGSVGLVFVVSSLFSNVIGTLALPLVPVFAMIFFHDKMNAVKVVAMLIAIWGFISYVYQHYLDDTKHKEKGGDCENPIVEDYSEP